MNGLDSGDLLDQLDRNYGLGIVFYPNLPFFSV